jgi:hypothetical protein
MNSLYKIPARRAAAAPVLALALALAAAGCSSEANPVVPLPRQAVSGTVTLDGQPLPAGTIEFLPAGGGGDSTPTLTSGGIKDGAFTIEEAQGPTPGKYRVAISSRTAAVVTADAEPSTGTKSGPEKVPGKYNKKTTLQAEVKGAGANTFTFDLTK